MAAYFPYFATAYNNGGATLTCPMPGKPLIFKAFRASLTLVPAGYIAAADAIGSSHLALGLGRVAVQAVAAADNIRLPGCQPLRNQPLDELLVLPALQVLLHGVVGPHHVLQVQGVARLIRLDGL